MFTIRFMSFSLVEYAVAMRFLFRYREVFHVVEDILCVPNLSCTLPTCTLKVINNDTLKEIPRAFLKVAPHIYRKNDVCHYCYM